MLFCKSIFSLKTSCTPPALFELTPAFCKTEKLVFWDVQTLSTALCFCYCGCYCIEYRMCICMSVCVDGVVGGLKGAEEKTKWYSGEIDCRPWTPTVSSIIWWKHQLAAWNTSNISYGIIFPHFKKLLLPVYCVTESSFNGTLSSVQNTLTDRVFGVCCLICYWGRSALR